MRAGISGAGTRRLAGSGPSTRLALLLRDARRRSFPPQLAGRPWLPQAEWASWEEPYRTHYAEYVSKQREKDAAVYAVRDALGKAEDYAKLAPEWVNGLKLHAATLPLAEFAAVIGNLRGARFGRSSAWRSTSLLGALDEFRHTQIPLLLMHELVGWDRQFDWTWRFYHSNNWVAIAARHLVDELLIGSDAIEFAIATHFVFETGFTNLQFVGLASMAHGAGDKMFEKMVTSIQTDEARHAQIGGAVLRTVAQHDRDYAQQLIDKWFWRSWLLFAVVTGFTMDYLTPLARADPVLQGVHAGVGHRPVRAQPRATRPAQALVLGHTSSSRSTTTTTWSTPAPTPTGPRSGSTSCCRGPRSGPGCAASTPAPGPSSIRSGSRSPPAGSRPIRATTSRCTARPSSASVACASWSCAAGGPAATAPWWSTARGSA